MMKLTPENKKQLCEELKIILTVLTPSTAEHFMQDVESGILVGSHSLEQLTDHAKLILRQHAIAIANGSGSSEHKAKLLEIADSGCAAIDVRYNIYKSAIEDHERELAQKIEHTSQDAMLARLEAIEAKQDLILKMLTKLSATNQVDNVVSSQVTSPRTLFK